MNALRFLYSGIVHIEGFVTKTLIVVITLLTFCSALSRAFGFPLPWSLELILLLFAWFAFLAASQASRRKTHLGVDILTMHLPPEIQRIIEIINNVLIIAFLCVLAYGSFNLTVKYSVRKITSLQISFSFVTAALLVGCSLMMISECIHIVNRIIALAGAGDKK